MDLSPSPGGNLRPVMASNAQRYGGNTQGKSPSRIPHVIPFDHPICRQSYLCFIRSICRSLMSSCCPLDDTLCGILSMPIDIGMRQSMITNVVRWTQREKLQACHFELALGVTLRFVDGYDYSSFMESDEFDVVHDRYSYADNGYPTVFAGSEDRPQYYCGTKLNFALEVLKQSCPTLSAHPDSIIPYFMANPDIGFVLCDDCDRMNIAWLMEHYPVFTQELLDRTTARRKEEEARRVAEATARRQVFPDYSNYVDDYFLWDDDVSQAFNLVERPNGVTQAMVIEEINDVFGRYGPGLHPYGEQYIFDQSGHVLVPEFYEDNDVEMEE